MPFTNDSIVAKSIVTTATKKYRVKDDSNYIAVSIDPANVLVNYKATLIDTGMVFHDNSNFLTPDIQPDVSLESLPIDYPTDSLSQAMLLGDILLEVTTRIRYFAPISEIEIDPPNSVFKVPMAVAPDLEVGMTFISSGNNNALNNGTFTIASLTNDGFVWSIVVAEELVAESGTPGAQIEYFALYTKSFTSNFNFTVPEIKIDVTHSCKTFSMVAKDQSALGNPTTDTRVFTGNYPVALGDQQPAPIVTSASILIMGPPIYTQTSVFVLSHDMTYVQLDNLIIECFIAGSKEHNVVCVSLSVCCLLPYIASIRFKFKKEALANQRSYYANTLLNIVALIEEIEANETCGNAEKAISLFEELKCLLEKECKADLSSCTCGCGSDELPKKLENSQFTSVAASAVSVVPFGDISGTNMQTVIEEVYALIQQIDNGTLDKQILAWDAGDQKYAPSFVLNPGVNPGDVPKWDGTGYVPAPSSVEEILAYFPSTYTNPTQAPIIDVPVGYLATTQVLKITGYATGLAFTSVVRFNVGGAIHDLALSSNSMYFEIYITRDADNIFVDSAVINFAGGQPSPAQSTAAVDFSTQYTIEITTINAGRVSSLSVRRFNID